MLENIQRVLSRIESIKSRTAGMSKGNLFNKDDSVNTNKEDFQNAVTQKIKAENKEIALPIKKNGKNSFNGSSYDVGSAISVLEKINEKNILQDSRKSAVKEQIENSGSDRIKNLISRAVQKNAGKFNIDPELIMAVIQTESSGDPFALSSAGAQGLMQLMPGTADDLNVKAPFDVNENIRGGTEYLARMIGRFDSVDKALAAYNAGPGNVEKYNGIPPFSETKKYVEKVKKAYNDIKNKGL